MAQDKARIELKCSNCGRVLGSVPEEGNVESPLECPNCGALVMPPGPVERLGEEIKKAVDRLKAKEPRDRPKE